MLARRSPGLVPRAVTRPTSRPWCGTSFNERVRSPNASACSHATRPVVVPSNPGEQACRSWIACSGRSERASPATPEEVMLNRTSWSAPPLRSVCTRAGDLTSAACHRGERVAELWLSTVSPASSRTFGQSGACNCAALQISPRSKAVSIVGDGSSASGCLTLAPALISRSRQAAHPGCPRGKICKGGLARASCLTSASALSYLARVTEKCGSLVQMAHEMGIQDSV